MSRKKSLGMRIEGAEGIDAALSELTKATARNAIKRALVRGAEMVAGEMESRAKRLTGRTADSVTASTKRPKGSDVGKAAYALAKRSGASNEAARAALIAARRANPKEFAEAYAGPSNRAGWAHIVEFGGGRQAPQPFVRPGWDASQGRVLRIVVDAMREEVAKAAKRAQRKARREGMRAIGSNTSAGRRRAQKAAARGFKVR